MVRSINTQIGLLSGSGSSNERIEFYLKSSSNVYGRIFLLLSEVMRLNYTVMFSDSGGSLLANGSWTGLLGMINRSEVDIAPYNFFMTEERMEGVHFAYPLNVDDLTFITKKPEYSPEVFAIHRTLSSSIWIMFAICFVIMINICYFTLKKNICIDKVILNILAICLKQPIIIRPSTLGQKCLIYVWVLGLFFFGLCYESVLLSFLTFPPLGGVKTVNELAEAVKKGDYYCMMTVGSSMSTFFSKSEDENLRIIGNNILKNPLGYGEIEDFLQVSKRKVAFVDSREDAEFLRGSYFISKDRFLQTMQAIPVSKNFCCKERLDRTLSRIMAAGFYQKFIIDRDFEIAYKTFSSKIGEEENIRKLTLIDISSAFIFLISGYCVSFVVLVAEVILNRKRK